MMFGDWFTSIAFRRPCASALWSALFVVIWGPMGCGRRESIPRTPQQLEVERQSLPVLYLTNSGREVIAPRNPDGVVVSQGELAFTAWECENPKCPGEKEPGRPSVFPWPNPLAYLKEDGTVGLRVQGPGNEFVDMLRKMDLPDVPTCPACRKQGQTQSCREYVLPETAQRLKDLDAEHRERIEYVKRLQSGATP